MSNARNQAVRILSKIEKDSSYSVLAVAEALKSVSFSDERDKSFAVLLIYGVLERKLTLDYNISLYIKSEISKLKSNVLNILRVGAYQILFMDKVPVSAAVNEAVKISKKTGASYASGMINAVLRKIADNGLKYPAQENYCELMSVKYSVNKSIFNSVYNDYGKDRAEAIFESFYGRRPIFIRHNTLLCTEDELIDSLESDGVSIVKTQLENCFMIDKTGDISLLDAYSKGMFYVQDMSSQFCCSLLDVKPGDTVVDCCAAPGGKSFTLAQYLKGEGLIYSCDIYAHKTELIDKGAKRLGINNLKTVCTDARNLCKVINKADKVLCDVPCSGFGVIGRKPEIRYKEASELCSLPEIQKEILYSCSRMVKKGGTLVYSTCTLNKKENDEICDSFLRDFPEFSPACDSEYRKHTDRYITIFPDSRYGDGFFVAKFVKG